MTIFSWYDTNMYKNADDIIDKIPCRVVPIEVVLILDNIKMLIH
jgi:hypothetical protein